MTIYVCKEWYCDEILKGEWKIVKAVKDELSARKWCGNDSYKRYTECELEE